MTRDSEEVIAGSGDTGSDILNDEVAGEEPPELDSKDEQENPELGRERGGT